MKEEVSYFSEVNGVCAAAPSEGLATVKQMLVMNTNRGKAACQASGSTSEKRGLAEPFELDVLCTKRMCSPSPPSSRPHRAQVLRLRGYLQDPLRLAGGAAAGLLPQQGQRPGHRHSPHRAGEDRLGVCAFPGGEQVNGTVTIQYDLILM